MHRSACARFGVTAALLTILSSTSCDSVTSEPELLCAQPVELAHPAIDQTLVALWFGKVYGPGAGSGMSLAADLPGREFLEEDEYLPVAVTTSSGAAYEAKLRGFCIIETGGAAARDVISVSLQVGHAVAELDPLLHKIDGKFVRLGEFVNRGPVGFIQIFTGTLKNARTQTLQWSGVMFSDYEGLLYTADVNPRLPPASTIIFTDPDLGPRDRTLLVSPGDRVTASYTNPDGTVLTAEVTLN